MAFKSNPVKKSRTRPDRIAWLEANKDKVALYRRRNYEKYHEKRLAYARDYSKKNYKRVVTGKPGSVKYEAKLAGYKSGFERTLASNMEMRGVNFKYESTKIPYILEGVYNPDFTLVDRGFHIEAKGLLDRDSKRKMAAVKQQHPELDIRFVFMDANKKIPGSKQTHAQWATKNGFLWADREIPEEWLHE